MQRQDHRAADFVDWPTDSIVEDLLLLPLEESLRSLGVFVSKGPSILLTAVLRVVDGIVAELEK